jgi:hypothetical protein
VNRVLVRFEEVLGTTRGLPRAVGMSACVGISEPVQVPLQPAGYEAPPPRVEEPVPQLALTAAAMMAEEELETLGLERKKGAPEGRGRSRGQASTPFAYPTSVPRKHEPLPRRRR